MQADGQGKQPDEIGENENLTLSLGDKPSVHYTYFIYGEHKHDSF